ncbi:MAG: Monofunctional biosynthetic peptidoglycan transglycosylase [Elusimicrobia bacterium]|nr:Monofunctional biosynthetic peptidoglycan transglycosylase [Elusimicrobiota bacterium]
MKKIKKKILIWVLGAIALLIFGIIAIIIVSEWKLSKLVPGGLGERFPTKVYSIPFSLSQEMALSSDEIMERIKRLNYQPSTITGISKGKYHWSPPDLYLGLRGFSSPTHSQEPFIIKMTQKPDGRWSLLGPNDSTPPLVLLEPELIAELSGPQKVRRDPATWEDYPPNLIEAVIVVEDKRFHKHHGIDPRGIMRAAWHNLRHDRSLQGGSTITQQLAKNFFLSNERTFRRKFLELGFALYLDLRYSKEKILTLYLNHIYMGQDGVVSIAGMKAAAEYYFGKNIREINTAESALLAGIIRSPYRYNPFQNPTSAKGRRNTVLKLLLQENVISELEYERALAQPLSTIKRTIPSTHMHDYFVAEVLRQLVPRFSEDVLFRYGLRIYTTMDPLFQQLAQRIVKKEKFQSAMVVIEPNTGRILALVGGRNYQESQFNRATQASRQPGSTFKPFIYGAGLEHGFTPASILMDEPRVYRDRGKIWAPQNFDGIHRGSISFRDALAQSINGATLDLAQKIGTSTIIRFARKLGIESPLENSLALALGTSEVTPLELTAAYAPFGNGGFRITPIFVLSVVDAEDIALEINNVERESVLDPAHAYLMTSLMETTITEGTAKNLKKMGWEFPSAGKTGTTNDGKDAWFVGYTPNLLVGVWVGSDEGKALGLSGSINALPLWGEFMLQSQRGRITHEFKKPLGIIPARIDPISGALARIGCPDQKNEMFINGTEPTSYCPLHSGGFTGWLKKIFKNR